MAKGCKRCAKSFNFLRRKHNCRQCGLVFCEQCTIVQKIQSTSTTSSGASKISMRYCIDCNYKLDSQKLSKGGPTSTSSFSEKGNEDIHSNNKILDFSKFNPFGDGHNQSHDNISQGNKDEPVLSLASTYKSSL